MEKLLLDHFFLLDVDGVNLLLILIVLLLLLLLLVLPLLPLSILLLSKCWSSCRLLLRLAELLLVNLLRVGKAGRSGANLWVYLRALFSESALELVRVGSKVHGLLRLSNRGHQLGRHSSLSHKFLLKLGLSSLSQSLHRLIDSSDLLNIAFLKSLEIAWIVNRRSEGAMVLAALKFKIIG